MRTNYDRTASTVVDRALRGDATTDELRGLAAWRAADPEHERCVRETERVLRLAWQLRPRDRALPPSAASIIARGQRSPTP
ncbi:MAG: DUF4880 domain-containing protein [Gemmatimonadota bacterium]|nr:DUF4880 domain-containing protein [Gemmatimonadota bacterium]